MAGKQRPQIVLAEPFDADSLACLERIGDVRTLEDSSPETLIAALGDADALLVRGKAHITARILDAAPRLKVIGRASPTIDHIDLRAAVRKNISIVYVPRVAVASTAEFALMLILAAHRRALSLDRQVREGKFETLREPGCREMSHETVGLMGMDAVADRLGKLCAGAFGCRVIYHDPSGLSPTEFSGEPREADELVAEADVVSVHLSHVPKARHFIGAARLARMKPTASLINVSRGSAIDGVALAEALKKKRIGSAALDVFEVEPLPMNHPIRQAPNCILTPHVAGATIDAKQGRCSVTEDVARVLNGEQPLFPYDLEASSPAS